MMASTRFSATRVVREETTVVVAVVAGAVAAREKAVVAEAEAIAVVPAEEAVPVETRSRRSLQVNHRASITPRWTLLNRSSRATVHHNECGVFPLQRNRHFFYRLLPIGESWR